LWGFTLNPKFTILSFCILIPQHCQAAQNPGSTFTYGSTELLRIHCNTVPFTFSPSNLNSIALETKEKKAKTKNRIKPKNSVALIQYFISMRYPAHCLG